MEKIYKVYDYYDVKEFLGWASDMKGIKKLAQERYDETDGECEIYYVFRNPSTQKIVVKFLETC